MIVSSVENPRLNSTCFLSRTLCAFEGGKLKQDVGNVASLHLNFEASHSNMVTQK